MLLAKGERVDNHVLVTIFCYDRWTLPEILERKKKKRKGTQRYFSISFCFAGIVTEDVDGSRNLPARF